MQHFDFINYKSSDDKPDDFDSFWTENIKSASYSNLQIKEIDKYANCSLNDLTWTSGDGAKIYAKYIYPTNKVITKVLLLFHGYHVNSGEWFDKIAYANQGIAVFALDCRGQSGKSEDNTLTKGSTLKGLVIKGHQEGKDNLHMVKQYLDTYTLSVIAQNMHNNVSQVTLGESQGGALSLICASLSPFVKLCISQYPYLSNFKLADKLNMPYSGVEDYFKWEDPQAVTYDEFFNILSYIDVHHFTSKITCPVHMLTGCKDDVSPPICQFSAFNNITSEKKYYLYPKYGHEYLQGSNDLKMKLILDL